tara:strand:- start:4469 stop:5497 length:1029 start_codon:yes stop_codon:yes gene_type:complete
MKKIIILFLMINICAQAQIKDFFKYSTFYTSTTMNTSFVERDDYIAIDKGYEDITQVNPYDYNLTIGLRKIARFDYEYKVKTWYYGTEKAVADNVTIGNSTGWEYLLNYSFIRNRGNKYTEQNFWIRYLGHSCITKLQYTDNQRVDLKYNSFDTRFRLPLGNWDLTIGGVFRIHDPYGIVPIEDFWTPGEQSFAQLAGEFGYSTEYVNGDWHWFNDGELIATSDDEFYKHYFGDAVASFNERELDKLGMQKEISAVIGLAYYKYTDKLWLHAWFNCIPLHYGLDDYSFEYNQEDWDNIEWDAGMVFGSRITSHLGMFIEGTHMRYWMKPIYEVKFGFNYLFF